MLTAASELAGAAPKQDDEEILSNSRMVNSFMEDGGRANAVVLIYDTRLI
jgi:hypothetical protein